MIISNLCDFDFLMTLTISIRSTYSTENLNDVFYEILDLQSHNTGHLWWQLEKIYLFQGYYWQAF